MSKKKLILILGILLGISLLLAAAYFSTAIYAQKKVETLLTSQLTNLGWDTSDIEVTTFKATPCLRFHTTTPLGSSLSVEEACIESGLPTLLTSSPDLEVKIAKISGVVDARDIESLKLRFSGKPTGAADLKLPGTKKSLKLANIGLDMLLSHFEMKVIQEDKQELMALSVDDAHLTLKDGQANASARIESLTSDNLLALADLKSMKGNLNAQSLSLACLSDAQADGKALKVYLDLNLSKGLGSGRLEMSTAPQTIHYKHKDLVAEIALDGMEVELGEELIKLALSGLVLDIPALRIDEDLAAAPNAAVANSDQPELVANPKIEAPKIDDLEDLGFEPNDLEDDSDDVAFDDRLKLADDIDAGQAAPNELEKTAPEIARFEKLSIHVDRMALMAALDSKDNGQSNKKLSKIIQELRLDGPIIQINAEKLAKNEQFLALPGVGALMSYWSKSAGSLLGGAPKKSAKFPPKPTKTPAKINKNPIPPEMMTAFRNSFKQLQTELLALPPIDIIDGTIKFHKDRSTFALKALSFKTRDLMSDDQKMHFDFTVGDARASFDVSFAEGSIYPRIQLNIDKLGAESFYKIINMPKPKSADGTFFGNLLFNISDDDLSIDAQMRFENFAFFHERISPNLVHDIEASAKMKFVYVFDKDLLRIDDVELQSGPITVKGTMGIDNVRSYPVIYFTLGAQDVPCEAIAQAIPPGLLPTITDLRMGGTAISPSLTGKIPWKDPLKLTLSETGFTNDCYPISVAPHYPEKLNAPDYTFTTNYTYFVDAIEVGPGTQDYTPIKDIPPYVRAAMFLTEDKRFLDHGPLRLSFIERAMRLNLNERRYIYGGSTISQQLVKNLFLDRKKNLARKLEEWFITWNMETVVTKTRIFELYLNIIEFGPDIYGIHQGAKFYFGKKPNELTPLEGAYLASLKVAPSKGGRFYYSGFSDKKWWNKRMRHILKILGESGYISMNDAIEAYPYKPPFVYPPPEDKSDFRNIWLANYAKISKYKPGTNR